MYTAKQTKLHTITDATVTVTESKRKPVINTGRGAPFSGIVAASTGDIFFDVSGSMAYWWNGSAWQNFNRYTDEVRIGTTAQRPANPDVGLVWLNTTTEKPEWYSGAAGGWKTFAGDVLTTAGYDVRTGLSGLFLWLDFSDADSLTISLNALIRMNEKSSAASTNYSTVTSLPLPYSARAYNNLGMFLGSRTAHGDYAFTTYPNGFIGPLRSTVSIAQNATVFLVHGVIRTIPRDFAHPAVEIWDGTGKTANYLAIRTGLNNGVCLNGEYSKSPTTSTTTFYQLSSPTVSDATWLTPNITTFVVTPTSLTLFLNGTQMVTKAVTTGTISVNQYRINCGEEQQGVTDYGEVIATNSALTTAKRQEIEGYLAWKWGIQSKLPSAHAWSTTNKTGGPTN